MKLDGLVSGLKTDELITALMDVAAIPKKLITNKITDRGAIITNLQSLNKTLQDLVTKAKTAAGQTSLAAFTATASSESVTVVAGARASAFSTSIVVDAVATSHSVITAAAGAEAWGGAFTLVASDGTQKSITPVGGAPQDLAKAINAAKAGVTATVVPAGTDADGKPLSRVQLTAVETGAAGAFTLHRGTAADVAAGTAPDVATELGAAVLTQGADAGIRLFAGTAAEQTLTSASNTISIGEDIDVTVTKASADPVVVSVALDAKAQTTKAETFVKEIAALLVRIDNGSKATVGAVGEKTTLGVFTGDSTVRNLRTALADAVQYPVDGVSPSTIGISISDKGVLSFDAEKFAAALADDPEKTQAVFAGLAGRLEAVTDKYSDKYDGLLTQRITGQESEVKTLKTQVERWDIRLEQRRATLERTYSQLEVQLSKLQSQSSWLASQLAGLTPTSSS
ncbi:Flagellar hook-associated protein 2 [Microbacterium oxydans]|uniref:Flagellar hook-associated protein 2 n=1 Tax=Microbacterium oxydans TaxID=82380 RepID=A0A0F0L3N3_9MICO|nr:flagellar filament capping protein FliD [Microbacterium oxydans]KJL27762.1 Flagellar hook-associated protein 2 [Microbacterium oxydans]CAH0242802.1 Flagellar hook-associated protein 2 [Microbacterium oxydans]